MKSARFVWTRKWPVTLSSGVDCRTSRNVV